MRRAIDASFSIWPKTGRGNQIAAGALDISSAAWAHLKEMETSARHRYSLKTRLTLMMLGIFLVGLARFLPDRPLAAAALAVLATLPAAFVLHHAARRLAHAVFPGGAPAS